MSWLPILQGFAAAVAYGLVLLVALRVSRRSPTLVVLATAAVVYVAAAAVFMLLGQVVGFWAYSTTYWFLVLCFLMAFGAIYKSLSLRILLDLTEKSELTGSADELAQRYIFGSSFEDRLGIAVDGGLAARSADGLSLTSRGRALASRVRAAQRAFGITRSG